MRKEWFSIAIACVLALGAAGTAFADDPDNEAMDNGTQAALENVIDDSEDSEGTETGLINDALENSESEDGAEYEQEVGSGVSEITIASGEFLSFGTPSPQPYSAGMSIELTISDDTPDRTYKIVWMKDGWKKWGIARDFEEDKEYTWTPAESGKYTLYIDIKEPDGTVSETKTFAYTITEDYTYSKLGPSESKVYLSGSPILLEPDVSGNTDGLQYKFVWMKNSWKNWGVAQAMGASDTCSWTPDSEGTYTVYCDVQDSTGKITTKSTVLSVGDLSIECAEGSTLPYAKGMSLTLNANTNLSDYSAFKFVYEKDNWKKWGVVRAFDPEKTATWNPTEAGTYTIYLDGQLSNGSVKTVTAKVTLTEDWAFDGFTATPESPQTLKTADESTITANTSGNNGALQYKFVWMKNNWKNWGVLQDRSDSNSAVFNWNDDLAKFGTGHYKIYCDIFDSTGKSVTEIMDYDVYKTWTWNGFDISAAQNPVGTPVTIKANTGAEDEDILLKFVWECNGWSSWGVIQQPSKNREVTFAPTKAGNYTFYCDVIDVDGEIETFTVGYLGYSLQGLNASLDMDTSGGLAVTLSPNWGSRAPAGAVYTYRWSNGSTSGTIASNTTKTKVSWTPSAGSSSYTFYVDVTYPDEAQTMVTKSKKLDIDPTGGRYKNLYSGTNYLLVIDATTHWLVIYKGSQYNRTIYKVCRCSNGAPETPTPAGEYTIYSSNKQYYFDAGYGARCFYATGFIGTTYLMHSTLYYAELDYPTTQWENDTRLGYAISHGCVRLKTSDAKWIYDNIGTGTVLKIYYS